MGGGFLSQPKSEPAKERKERKGSGSHSGGEEEKEEGGSFFQVREQKRTTCCAPAGRDSRSRVRACVRARVPASLPREAQVTRI